MGFSVSLLSLKVVPQLLRLQSFFSALSECSPQCPGVGDDHAALYPRVGNGLARSFWTNSLPSLSLMLGVGAWFLFMLGKEEKKKENGVASEGNNN